MVRQLRLREGADLGGVRVDGRHGHGLFRGLLECAHGPCTGQEAAFHRRHGLVVEVHGLGQVLAQVFHVAGDDAEALVQLAAQRDHLVRLFVDGRPRPRSGARARDRQQRDGGAQGHASSHRVV